MLLRSLAAALRQIRQALQLATALKLAMVSKNKVMETVMAIAAAVGKAKARTRMQRKLFRLAARSSNKVVALTSAAY
jgi:hypothetical protein